MTDISINKSINNSDLKKKTAKNGEYARLKKDYESFMNKSKKSDFINSPVFKQKQLEFLNKLESAALKEKLPNEAEIIRAQKSVLTESLENNTNSYQKVSYYNPAFKGSGVSSNSKKLLSACADSNGKIDENTSRIINAFEQKTEEGYDLSYELGFLLKKCRNFDEQIPLNIVEAVETLAKAGADTGSVIQIIEQYSDIDDDYNRCIDLSLCGKYADLKEMGFENTDALRYLQFFDGSYENEKAIKSSIQNMQKVKIPPATGAEILKTLSTRTVGKKEKKISTQAVKSVISLKRELMHNRNNEQAERDNPINMLGVSMVMQDDKVLMVIKNGEVVYDSLSGEIVSDRNRYNELISEFENDILVKFAKKKDKNGETDTDYLRTITALRRSGITYDQLFPLSDFCFENGGIDEDKLNTVCTLKNSGCLCVDIIDLMNSLNKTPDGLYDREDIQNACDLTSAVIGGKETAALLPEVKGNDNLKEFIINMSGFFENKSNLLKLLPLIKDENGHVDENAMNELYNLAQKTFVSEQIVQDGIFMNKANELLKKNG